MSELGTAAPGGQRFDVSVLGPLRVLVDGRAVELGPVRRRTLLAALAIDPGRIVPLDTLVDRVWDGRPTANPSATVHAYVSRLRGAMRSFEADGTERPSPLATRAPGYVLDVDPAAVDTHRFDLGLARAHELAAADDPAAAASAVREVLALWRGTAFADIPAAFARRESERLGELRAGAQELAVELELALGRHEALVPEIRRLVDADPWREGLHASLILALYRSGRQADALQQYATVRGVLDEELGIGPGPALRRLHELVLRQDPELDLPASVVAADRTNSDRPAEPVAPGVALGPDGEEPQRVAAGPRTVGRDGEIERVRAWLRRVPEGRAVPLALVGEAGIGKTQLADELARAAAAAGHAVAWGRCWQHEGAPSLWPWLQAVEAVLDELSDEERAALVDGRTAPAATVLPALGVGLDQGAAVVEEVRLYDAFAQLLVRLAARRPLVLVLDDVHWADRASRELAEYVAGAVRDVPFAMAVTVRSPTEDSARVGTELLGALARTGRAERIDLGGLSASSVRDYVVDRTGSVLDDATTDALTERTGGNPFFVGELVRLLVTDAETGSADDGAGPVLPDDVPESVREVIVQRLRRLPEEANQVLRVAAVLGRTFDLDLIERVCDLDEDAVDEAVDLATELGVIVSDSDVVGRHRFVHALTQQALLETTGPARLRRLHGRVAAELDRPGVESSPARAERLTFHLGRAGGRDELARAVALCVATADQTRARGNYPETEALLLRALDLGARLGDDDGGADAREVAVRTRLATLYVATEGPGAARDVAQREHALRLIDRHGGPRDILAAHQVRFSGLIWVDDLVGAATLVGEILATAETLDDDVMRLAGHHYDGQVLLHRGRLAEAGAAQVRAAEVLDRLLAADGVHPGIFPSEPVCSVPLWRALTALLQGDAEGCDTHLGSLARVVATQAPATRAYVSIVVGMIHALRDAPQDALESLLPAADLARTHGLDESLKFAEPLMAWARAGGVPDDVAVAAMAAAVALSDSMPTMALRPTLLGLQADVLLRADRADEALAVVDRALGESAETGDDASRSDLHRFRAEALRGTGGGREAVARELRLAREVAERQGAGLALSRLG